MAKQPEESRGDHDERRARREGARGEAERALARFARSRHDVVTAAELRRFGLGRDAIAHRRAVGRLHRVHRGVYVLGTGSLSQRGRWRAAVAACGEGALLSHRSAAALWGLIEDERIVVDVTVPTGGRSRRGIRVHEARGLEPHDRAERSAIPLTAVPRTLVDLAGCVSAFELERAVIEAARLELLAPTRIEAACRPNQRGVARLREIIHRNLAAEVAARSELERRFLGLCRRHQIPLPEMNVRIEGFLVDALWRDAAVVVELDGYAYHRLPGDQRRDAARTRALTLAGLAVVRFGWEDVTKSAATTAATLTDLVLRRSARR